MSNINKLWEEATKKVLDRYGEDGIQFVMSMVDTDREEAIEILHNFGIQGNNSNRPIEDIVDQWEDWED